VAGRGGGDRIVPDGSGAGALGAGRWTPPLLLYAAAWALLTPPLLAVGDHAGAAWAATRVSRASRAWHLAAMAAAAPAAAVAQLHLFAIGAELRHGTTLVNVPEETLLFLGRFRENLAVACLLLAAQVAVGRRRAARDRELQASRLAAQLAEARLRALAMELQPHFLFNTLNAISGLVHSAPDRADAMLLQLSELLQRTLEAGAQPVTALGEELRVLGLYLDIQRVRFGPRLTVQLRADPALAGAQVPRFLLQPLVENAFKHGLGPKRGPVTLGVEARRERGQLVLVVVDDGVGLPSDGQVEESTGVGNTRQRLAELYPGAHSFVLRERTGGGCVAEIRLPLRLADTAAAASASPDPPSSR
jgi:two-component system LytT family sensor kinase